MSILSSFGDLARTVSGLSKKDSKIRTTNSIQYFQNKVVSEFLFQNRDKKNQWVYDEVSNSKRKLGSIENSKGVNIGSMYIYIYNAKHKNILPYWDALPLVIPIKKYKDGFLGLNFHYLPPKVRLILLNGLLQAEAVSNNESYMKLSYQMLNSVTKSKYIEPTIKRYLYTHVKSNFAKINPEWEKIIMLPVSKFQKASKSEVWEISMSGGK